MTASAIWRRSLRVYSTVSAMQVGHDAGRGPGDQEPQEAEKPADGART